MKIFKLMAIALVAMVGLNSCSEDCDHNFIEYDYNEALVGTWTYLEEGQAEAMVINPDGSFAVTGIMKGGALYEEKGTIKVVNNKVTLAYNTGDVFEGRLELVAGKSLSIVLNEEYDIRLTYDYCENDLADEVVGMWVCTYVSTNNEDFNIYQDAEMAINIYQEDGKSIFTGFVIEANDYMANVESTYKVIGDLMLESNPLGEGIFQYNAFRLTYSPNSNQFGDMLTKTSVMAFGDEVIEFNASMLRIRQSLDLAGKKYDYIKTFVSNVDGLDQDINFMGYTFNFAKMDGTTIDQMLKALLFSVEFPDANTIKYSCRFSSGVQTVEAPIAVTR